MNRLFVILLATFCTSLVYSQVTFTKDVAKIIYNKCTSCHRQGEIGPFSLMNYQDTKQRAGSIKRVTLSKFMPPWKPDPSFSRHLGENFLTDEEIKKISDWVDGGAPYGNASEEPPLPNFPTGSALGKPDLVLSFSKKHIHKGDNKDKYRYFVLPSGLLEDKIVKAVEVRPGNAQIVHHALIFQDTTGQAKLYDSRTPEYGFEGTSGFSTEQVIFFTQYPGYAPGQKALYFPDGIGQKLNKGADMVIQVHYAPISKDESDSTTINVFFADKTEKVNRFVQDYILLPFNLVTGAFSFIIQPNTVPTFEGRFTLTEDRSIMGIFPHMHLLGKKWEVWLERPDGSKENLVRINDWDFNWQSNYYFKRYIPAPKGSVIVAKATYDNTSKNPYNPFSPPRRVSWGQQFRVTRSRGFWLRTLDGRPASETYAQLFGYPARDWAFPPLNHLARLYPLGVEQGDELIVRAPIRVEADGSFRMNATICDGIDAYLLVGSRVACEKAARQAAQQALLRLGDAKPAFALILVDVAWQMLLKAQPDTEIAAVQEILGAGIPIAGGYTLGQIVPGETKSTPRFLNQHIVVIAFGEQ